ncbi:MAG: LptF/LptG family permease, partial [Kiritimatiellaeota bacterium]|nr:LptF/LptG family permease [Kiritimatiellota bacterium]
MRLITRYVLKEFMGPLLVCLATFNALFLMLDLFNSVSRFVEARLPWYYIVRYYGGMVSHYSHWFSPAALLLATLYTMWRLSRNSEITAMRVSGISFAALAFPFIAVALTMATLTAAVREFVAPDAFHWAIRLQARGFSPSQATTDFRHNYVYLNPVTR